MHCFHSELHPKGVEQSEFFSGQRRVIQLVWNKNKNNKESLISTNVICIQNNHL